MIDEIAIAWFRGSADRVALTTSGQSIIVFGPNGSGKSSFVDALELMLRGDRIDHLKNEYSGKRMELAIVNTHISAGSRCSIECKLVSGDVITADISNEGAIAWSGREKINDWEARRVLLRQHDVAEFITDSKTGKYTALLPLIGLGPLENIANNIRALKKKVEERGELSAKRGRLEEMHRQWGRAFPDMDLKQVADALRMLVTAYAPNADAIPKTVSDAVDLLYPIIQKRLNDLTDEHARYRRVQDAHTVNLSQTYAFFLDASNKAAKDAEPFLQSRLEILAASKQFSEEIELDKHIECPACGSKVLGKNFKDHVEAELERLAAAVAANNKRMKALADLIEALNIVIRSFSADGMREWLISIGNKGIHDLIEKLGELDFSEFRENPTQEHFEFLSLFIPAVSQHLDALVKNAPLDLAELIKAKDMLEAASQFPTRKKLKAEINRIIGLSQYLDAVEAQVRGEIRGQTEAIIKEISDDMQRLWGTLHPDEPIEGVRLYQDERASRAIDIALKFYGKDQLSPRLTLSEGHRNSLGLCVFLAISKRPNWTKPVILDDVVTSFDREHRSRIVDLLNAEFSDRQIIILTHEYDWYVELQQRLPGSKWQAKMLLPWQNPKIGIRWNPAASRFDEARDLLKSDSSQAAALARSTMDIRMAVIAEDLELPMPFIRGGRSDLRHAPAFVNAFLGRAKSKFKKNDANDREAQYTEILDAASQFSQIGSLWGNPGAHGRYVSADEAKRLIDVCEKILDLMNCQVCKKPVWFERRIQEKRSFRACSCGALKWDL